MKVFYTELARNLDLAFVVVLSEHLNYAEEHPETLPHSENISQSSNAWLTARNGFLEIEQKFKESLNEWYAKWELRFKTEETAKIIAEQAENIASTKNLKERERLSKMLYLSTVHLMLGDAQKCVVTLNGRVDFLQETIRKIWHKNCSNDSYSKILPSIESSLQDYEKKLFSKARDYFEASASKDSIQSKAQRDFLEAIMLSKNNNFILNYYFSNVYKYVYKISVNLCKFHSKKWDLYTRGFRNNQHTLPLGMP